MRCDRSRYEPDEMSVNCDRIPESLSILRVTILIEHFLASIGRFASNFLPTLSRSFCGFLLNTAGWLRGFGRISGFLSHDGRSLNSGNMELQA